MDSANQTSSPRANTSTAVARKSYPISFNLHDRDLQHVLYILDDPAGQHLTLELTNSSGREIVLAKDGSTADEAHHHFELRFRPGTLAAGLLDRIALATEGWSLGRSPAPSDHGPVSLYLLSTKDRIFEAGKGLTLELEHLNTDGRGGARGTRVELRHKNLKYSGSPQQEVARAPRIEHLSIVNHRGQKNIPLHVGFVGSNTILNDQSLSPNELTLRITNVLKDRSIPLNRDSKFIMSFDAYQGTEQKEWALAEVSNVADIRITSEVWKKNNGRWEGSAPTTISREGSVAQSPEWPLQLAEPVDLGPGEYLLLNIKELRSGAPSGHANLYVRYENIPGYWDGQFVCVIEKGPLVYRGDNVGIGTTKPGDRLTVAGGAAFGPNYAGKFTAPANGLIVQGNVGIGTTSPRAALQVGDQPANAGEQDFGNGAAAMFTCGKSNLNQGPETVMVLAREGVSGGSYANFARFDLGMFEPIGSKSQLDIRLSHGNLAAEKKDTPVVMSLRSNGNVVLSKAEVNVAGPILTLANHAGGSRTGGAIDFNGYNVGNNPATARIRSLDDGHFSSSLAFYTKDPTPYLSAQVTADQAKAKPLTERMRINSDGQIGIGTESPEALLHLSGSQPFQAPVGNGANASAALKIIGGKGGNADSGKGGAGGSVIIRGGDGGNGSPPSGSGAGGTITLQPGKQGDGSSDPWYEALLLSPDGGRVGIGTNNPQVRLDVGRGTIRAGGIDLSGADMAENYFSEVALAPGDVVCLDRNHDGIVRSEKPDDLLAVGVISTDSGMLLNAGSNGQESQHRLRPYPVALRGRVPCKVVDENGPIKRGDLLTTSSTTGHAMKASPVNFGGTEVYRPGTIIGKALEVHNSGKGVIEVLITGG